MPEAVASITTYTAEKMRATFATVVEHGADANFPRPDAVLVIWRGTVEPVEMAIGDMFLDMS